MYIQHWSVKKGQEKDRKEENELDKQKKRTQYRTQ